MAKAKKTTKKALDAALARVIAKKSAKSSTGAAKPKGPGVISIIIEMISREEGASKDEILKILVKKFPDRDPDGMSKTIIIQANRNKSSKEQDEKRGIVFSTAVAPPMRGPDHGNASPQLPDRPRLLRPQPHRCRF